MNKQFDYIIVGAGSAGCVLANRLTQSGENKVLLLETGGNDNNILIQMPTALSYPMNTEKFCWQFYSEPEPYLDNRKMHCPRGKVMGGSSSINGMVYVRGHARDYVDAMWRMLQQDTPGDYVIATGSVHSVRELVEAAFGHIDRTLVWDGAGVSETGRDAQTGELLVCVDPQFFRPTEIFCPRGDARKAQEVLGWSSTTKFEELVCDMVRGDIALLQQASPKLHSASTPLLSAEG